MSANKQTISGAISGIRYRTPEGWSVFSLKADKETITCTGVLAQMVDVDTEVTCTGVIENSKFGEQLKCESIVPIAPDISTDAGVVKILQRLPGIGPKKAMSAVMQFGRDTAWEYAITDPEKIGVPRSQREEAVALAKTLLYSYETTVYLLGIGLTDRQASIIQKEFGADSIRIVSQYPYSLTKVDGFGFLTVDKIALKAGMSVGSPARIAACILYFINESTMNGGNIWHSGWALSDQVVEVLKKTAMDAEVSVADLPNREDVRKQILNLEEQKEIAIQVGKVFPHNLLRAEQSILDFVGVEYA